MSTEVDEAIEIPVREVIFETLLQDLVRTSQAKAHQEHKHLLEIADRIVNGGDRRLAFEMFRGLQLHALNDIRKGLAPATPEELRYLLDTLSQMDGILANWPESPVV